VTAREAADPTTLAEVAELLRRVTGEDARWLAGIVATSRLDGELRLDSIELTALGQALRERYGDRVDLAGFVADLDLDQIIALTVGDVAAYVAGCGAPVAGPEPVG
jgi:acyl carrier protein